jgi:hypothetical protein
MSSRQHHLAQGVIHLLWIEGPADSPPNAGRTRCFWVNFPARVLTLDLEKVTCAACLENLAREAEERLGGQSEGRVW